MDHFGRCSRDRKSLCGDDHVNVERLGFGDWASPLPGLRPEIGRHAQSIVRKRQVPPRRSVDECIKSSNAESLLSAEEFSFQFVIEIAGTITRLPLRRHRESHSDTVITSALRCGWVIRPRGPESRKRNRLHGWRRDSPATIRFSFIAFLNEAISSSSAARTSSGLSVASCGCQLLKSSNVAVSTNPLFEGGSRAASLSGLLSSASWFPCLSF